MISFENIRKEIALIEKELVVLETPKFRGQKEDFPCWISKVDQVFARYNIEEQEKFKVVIKKLQGHALEWWEKYKCKRKKRGKSKIKTWDKLRGKLMDAFAPTSYLHNHPLLSFEVNDFNSSSKTLPFNKGSPMSACISTSTSFLCLEKPNPNKDKKILGEEALSLVDLPPVFNDYGDGETVELEAQRFKLKQEEIVQGYEQCLTQEGCQEDIEVNWNLPPRFDEHEVEEHPSWSHVGLFKHLSNS